MSVMETLELPKLFEPHPNFSDAVNSNIIQSEIEGGVYLRELALGAVIEVETRNRVYKIVNMGDGDVLISGHQALTRPASAPGCGYSASGPGTALLPSGCHGPGAR